MSIDPQHVCYGCFSEKEPGTVCPHCGFTESAERAYLAVPLGTILDGRYLIGKVLGVGGFGITYLGYDLTLDYKVAVKEYMPSGFATRAEDKYTLTVTSSSQQQAYDEGLDKFLSEARTLAKFHNTPNIVSVQDFFKENNTAYFVMEYVDGKSLKDILDKNGGRITYDAASGILLPVMKALSKVHAQGLIHRDISPDNISINATGESKLLDFGAARSAYAETKSVSVILKHGLAPIEQYSNHGNMGPWTDVYAMGATFYRCITGILPPESIERIHADSIRTPSSMGISIPPYAELALMKALAVNPENRFANIEQFIDALKGNAAYSPAAPQMPVAPVVPAAAPVAAQVRPQAPVYSVPAAVRTTGYTAAQPANAFGQSYSAPAVPAATPAATPAAPKKKGMSKGAVAALIIGGVAIILTVVGTIAAINIANNSNKPRHTTETDDDDGGHFGSKETTYYTTDTTESTDDSDPTDVTTKSTASSGNGSGDVTSLSDIGASIWIPDGYVKNEKGFYSTSNGGFSVNYAEIVKDKPVYSISDVMDDKQFFIEYYLGKSVVETNSGNITIDNKTAFEIDGEYSGSKFILVAIPNVNPSVKAGCYFISAWFRNNEEGTNISKAIKSFKATSTVNTKLNGYSADISSNPEVSTTPDIRVKFLFEPRFSSGFKKTADSVWPLNNTNVTDKTMVMYMTVSSAKTQDEVREASKDKFTEEFKANNATLTNTTTTSVSYNNINWTIDTHNFSDRFEAKTITAVYPNGMIVCIHAKYVMSKKYTMDNYIKDLERSIRVSSVT